MSHKVDSKSKPFEAGAALGEGILVYLSSGKLAAAGLAQQPIGVVNKETFADGDWTDVDLLSAQGTIRCVASGAFSKGASVYGRASGKIDDISTSSAVLIGVAMEAATADGDIIEVMPV